jgi:6-phosphogluconolactonase
MKIQAYVSVSSEDKILKFEMNPDTGDLKLEDTIPAPGSPGPLATDPQQKYLYAGRRGASEISSFNIDPRSGDLDLIGVVSVEADPCYLSTDTTGRFLLSASYGGGVVGVHPIGEKGCANGPPVVWHETEKKAHCIMTDPSNNYAFVPHVGESNGIYQFRFDEGTGQLTRNETPKVSPEEGVGPRHFVFHPNRNTVYVSNEQGSSVTAYNFDPSNGTLEAFQTLSTLPDGYSEENSCAQIHITASGAFLYVSNRGHDSIACYATDPETGSLTALGQQDTESVPRGFNIDPTGNFLYAGGQSTGMLASYRIDQNKGTLTPLESYEIGKQSMWIEFVTLQSR